MSDVKLAKVDDVIEHGQDIPANVVRMRDAQGGDYSWRRVPDRPGRWDYVIGSQPPISRGSIHESDLEAKWFPMTVVEVDPEPQPTELALDIQQRHAFRSPAGQRCNVPVEQVTGRAEPCCRSEDHAVHQPQPERDVEDDVHYYFSELRSYATYCGLGIDDELSTTDEAGKATCDTCRAVADEDAVAHQRGKPAEPVIERLLRITGVDRPEHLAAAVQNLVTAFRTTPAESGPLVITLPEVPAEAVALVDRHGRRWALRTKAPQQSDWLWESESEAVRTYGALLIGSGPLTVELAPPREPRTWPKLDPVGDGYFPDVIEVCGEVFRRVDDDHWANSQAAWRTWAELRTLGEVREVLT